MKEHIKEWLAFIIGAAIACINDIIGVAVVFILLFVIDFITGIIASICRGETIESHKLRWSFVKMLCYFGVFALTLFFGIVGKDREVFDFILKMQVYVAAYFECVSISENMMSIFPRIPFFKWLHHMLTVQWIKKISGLKEAFKEHKPINTKQDD